jgi:hypothetical protein
MHACHRRLRFVCGGRDRLNTTVVSCKFFEPVPAEDVFKCIFWDSGK